MLISNKLALIFGKQLDSTKLELGSVEVNKLPHPLVPRERALQTWPARHPPTHTARMLSSLLLKDYHLHDAVIACISTISRTDQSRRSPFFTRGHDVKLSYSYESPMINFWN